MNSTELLAWAETPRPFDDMTYCGVDVTLATVKRAIREAMQEAREECEALALENHGLRHGERGRIEEP